MSISLVVIRLELADDSNAPKGLEFNAPGFEIKPKMSSAEKTKQKNRPSSAGSYGEGTQRDRGSTEGRDQGPLPEDVLKLNTGQRKLQDMKIETLTRVEESGTPGCDDRSADADPPSQWMGKIGFFSGNPTVETVKGFLHIYKNNEMTSLNKGISRSQTICMLAVPAKLTCIDLLQFVAPSEEFIEHIKIIRDATPNQYMALIKFKNQELADEFYNTFNGHPYNSFEEEVCHLVYVAKVEMFKSAQGASLACPGLTELPKCPVCLERMDESVEGVLTILCNHSFHGSCLSKWSDTTCPVCRYLQSPEPTSENKCFMCDSKESLWICLICGHIGCGRYESSHAYRHYEETHHTYSLQLGTQRVWDYTGDNYVHRLVQNKSDGKLVEFGPGERQVGDDEKLDSLTLEYTYLLTNQLENQRLYFQEKVTHIEQEAAAQVAEQEERTKKTLGECKKLEMKLADCEKEKRTIDKKYTQVVGKVGELVNDLKEERVLNKCLRENQALWQEKVNLVEQKLHESEKIRNTEVRDLQEQVADLMRHLEAQEAISCAPEETRQELQEGQMFVGAESSSGSSQQQSRKTRRKHR